MKRAAATLAAILILAGVVGATGITARHRKPRPPATPASVRQAPPIDLKSWINTKRLTPADLKDKVRLVEFWTFGCVNCQNTVLAMREIDGLYSRKGLVVLGIHSPEFPAERDSTAVAAAVRKAGIRFPVALDNDHRVFNAFKNKYWPALYLVDRSGDIVARHIGELHTDTRAFRNLCAAIDSALVARVAIRN